MCNIIYTASAIDLATCGVPEWRKMLAVKLANEKIICVLFDPSTAYKLANFGSQCDRRDAYIEAINKQALDLSDAVVVLLSKFAPSIGTPIELEFSYCLNKPIFLVTDIVRGSSVYLDNRVPNKNWIHVADMKNENNISDALDGVVARISSTYDYDQDM